MVFYFLLQNGTISTSQYTLHQAKGDAKAGHRKCGYLLKRSEGRLKNVWQRRRCEVRDGFLKIHHADESKTPSQVNLLTCQMKPVLEGRLCFDVVSYNRTYHFQAETETDKEEWMSVLLNSKEVSLNRAFEDNGKTGENQGLVEFQQTLVNYIRNIPSNNMCCDCGGSTDVTWLSTNFGVIVCIECSGIHREMGVHITKIQSLTLDNIGTSQLLVSRTMSNERFNKIMEATTTRKLEPNSTMEERKEYIRAKYIDRAFIQPYCSNARELVAELEAAIDNHSVEDLLQASAECQILGCDLTDPLPNSVSRERSNCVSSPPLQRFISIIGKLLQMFIYCRSFKRPVYITQFHKKLADLFTLLIFSSRTRVTLTGRQRKETLHSTTVSFRTSQKPCDCCSGPEPAQIFPTTTGILL